VRSTSLLLLLSFAVILFGPIQRLSLISTASQFAVLAGVHNSRVTYTREEVPDKGIDLSTDARREGAKSSILESMRSSHQCAFVDDAEVEVSPLRRLVHRRISPSAPDDAFHLA
jgi:hypothetical protein